MTDSHAVECLHWIARDRLLTLAGAGLVVMLSGTFQSARSDPINEPRVFASTDGALDLLMVAKSMPVPTISFQPPSGGAPIHPIGWVYEICRRPPSGIACPTDATTVADYGGARLALVPGDVLKIRFVNQLPSLDPEKVKHGKEPGGANLFRNPTNLHTHGLIVAPRTPTVNDPTFGDYVFLQVYNSTNGMPEPETTHQHGSIKMDVVDYRIDIGADHPSGLYWFHPHVHGISLNQVSSGLAGIITIGDVHDYVRGAPQVVRHLILKDMQVMAAGAQRYDFDDKPVTVVDGEVQNQQVADFCEPPDNSGPMGRNGYCDGEPNSGTGNNFLHSRWYFTINGQVYPTIRVTAQDGEIWRVTNASAQVTYRLTLVDDATNRPMLMQLVAIDGVSISVPTGTPAGTVTMMGGNKFTAADCPPGKASFPSVCVSDLVMMPASRAEVWVAYRNAAGTVVAPPPQTTATLKQMGASLGPGAENWPQLKLAAIEFASPATTKGAVEVIGPKAVGSSLAAMVANQTPSPLGALGTCRTLPDGHHRRIFFGVVNPSDPKSPFGLGYEEVVDQTGAVVPGTQVPVTAFDPAQTLMCLPLGPGGSTVHEIWELINLSTETHNFHIHQTKFRVLAANVPKRLPGGRADAPGILEDNVPVPYGIPNIDAVNDTQNGYCTIDQWRAGQCTATPIVLDVPFSQSGEFVFHCHILEHEDSGMMAKIQVTAGHP